jgi:hypothetical protein
MENDQNTIIEHLENIHKREELKRGQAFSEQLLKMPENEIIPSSLFNNS